MRLQSAQRRGALAPALPVAYPALANYGLYLCQGQLSLTVAGPGVGKSMLWLNFCQRMNQRTIYWSADTDVHDVLVRVQALHSGVSIGDLNSRRDDPAWAAWFTDQLAKGNHVDWVMDSTITSQGLLDRLNAHVEIYGEYPALAVVDNLSNVVQNQEQEAAEQKAFIKDAQEIARQTRTHVAMLAHATGEYDDGMKPIPMSGIYNKLGKLPEVVLTLHKADEAGHLLGLNVVKNRGGRADSAARHPMRFEVRYERASVDGWAA